jgi:hypothetical protein
MKRLLRKFPSILRTGDVMPTQTHGVEQYIHMGSHPQVFAKSCRLDLEKLEIAKVKLKRLESAGIVRSSKSPWASPLHMVPKKDGSWQPCGDYCCLNLVTTLDKYPLPKDLQMVCMVATFFQKLILSKVITKSLLQLQTSQKRQLSHHLACLSICSRRLGCLMLHRPSVHDGPHQ